MDTSHLKVEGNWSLIWKLKITPKIKHFIRRIQRDCLPTRARLVQKGVICPSTCTYCMSEFENAWHLFVNCPKAREIWHQAYLWELVSERFAKVDGIRELVFELLQQQNSWIAMILCSIWICRNEKAWDDTEKPTTLSLTNTSQFFQEWLHACSTNAPTPNSILEGQLSNRQPPQPGTLKCNLDAALFNENNTFNSNTHALSDFQIIISNCTAKFQFLTSPRVSFAKRQVNL